MSNKLIFFVRQKFMLDALQAIFDIYWSPIVGDLASSDADFIMKSTFEVLFINVGTEEDHDIRPKCIRF